MCPTETTTFCISRAKTVMLNEECARNYSNAFVELVFSMNGEKLSDNFFPIDVNTFSALFALSGVCVFGLGNAYAINYHSHQWYHRRSFYFSHTFWR